ncbi:MAG: hypothetical protein ACNA7W_00570 [Pseudomonadales bacterium]
MFVVLAGMAASLASLSLQASDSEWRYRTAVYAWATSLDGDIGVAPLPALAVDQSFADAWSSLDFAAMAVLEARRDRWGIFMDLQYVDLSEAGRVPQLGLDGRASVEARTALLAGSYRVAEGEQGHLDLVAGIRHWSLDVGLRLNVPPGVPLPSRRDVSRSMTVPQLGAKGIWALDGALFLTGWVLAGAAGNTDLNSDLMIALGYELSPRAAVLLGYRRVDLNYRGGRLDLDVGQHGPGLALDLRF